MSAAGALAAPALPPAAGGIWRPESACRGCGARGLASVLELGPTPLADRLLSAAELAAPDVLVPLTLVLCPSCSLAQIAETVAPAVLFGGDYPYFSSVSSTLAAHSRANAEELIARLRLGPRSLVVEIASNDGYLLKHFVARGIPVLGIDPAPAPAAAAQKAGVRTLNTFFGLALAERLVVSEGQADLILANNVLAHVADLNGLVAGIARLLAPQGVAVLEMPYVADLLAQCEFDTIYHQHLCYFGMIALERLFHRHGLSVNDVRRLPIHGGSLRLYVGHREEVRRAVVALLAAERASGLDGPAPYLAFAARAGQVRAELCALIGRLRAAGARLAAYGAAAKGTTLLSYCGFGRAELGYVVDRNPFKQGRHMPGSRLPIRPVAALLEDRPDVTLLLPWNFADEILAEQAAYRAAGGRFLLPIPQPRLV
jgi:SAM-dependent methyltransferase